MGLLLEFLLIIAVAKLVRQGTAETVQVKVSNRHRPKFYLVNLEKLDRTYIRRLMTDGPWKLLVAAASAPRRAAKRPALAPRLTQQSLTSSLDQYSLARRLTGGRPRPAAGTGRRRSP